jgi:hypothetical protein
MRALTRVRPLLREGGPLLRAGFCFVSVWPVLAGLAAADPPTANKTSPEQSSAAKQRQEAETELRRLSNEAGRLEQSGKLPEAIAAGERRHAWRVSSTAMSR